jgi:hypothetical protein
VIFHASSLQAGLRRENPQSHFFQRKKTSWPIVVPMISSQTYR